MHYLPLSLPVTHCKRGALTAGQARGEQTLSGHQMGPQPAVSHPRDSHALRHPDADKMDARWMERLPLCCPHFHQPQQAVLVKVSFM